MLDQSWLVALIMFASLGDALDATTVCWLATVLDTAGGGVCGLAVPGRDCSLGLASVVALALLVAGASVELDVAIVCRLVIVDGGGRVVCTRNKAAAIGDKCSVVLLRGVKSNGLVDIGAGGVGVVAELAEVLFVFSPSVWRCTSGTLISKETSSSSASTNAIG